MLEYIEKTSGIYDFLALCCSYILKEDKNTPIEYNMYGEEKYEEIYDAIGEYTLECENIGQKRAFNILKKEIKEFMKTGVDAHKCLEIIWAIDDQIEVEISDRLLGGNHIVEYTALNEQFTDQVKIIPCMRETFLTKINARAISESGYSFFRNRRDSEWSSLDKVVNNYMIWNEDYIKQYPLTIYHLDGMNAVTNHLRNRNKIVFGIVPFSNEDMEDIFQIKYEERTFSITGLKGEIEEALIQDYQMICKRAESANIDFLIFPEMLMTEKIMASLRGNRTKTRPCIIVNGSIWKDRINKSIITDENGIEILSYCKKEPFIYEKNDIKYTERLDQNKNTNFCIMDLEGIGRVGIAICKDLVNEKVKLFHKYMGTDLLIVPAYTKSMDLQGSAQELSKEYNCVVIVANSCSALESRTKAGRVGFITLPAKMKSDRTEVTLEYKRNECMSRCAGGCMGKSITLDFGQEATYDSQKSSYAVSSSTF